MLSRRRPRRLISLEEEVGQLALTHLEVIAEEAVPEETAVDAVKETATEAVQETAAAAVKETAAEAVMEDVNETAAEAVEETVAEAVKETAAEAVPKETMIEEAGQEDAIKNVVCYPCNMCDEVCSSTDLLMSHVQKEHLKGASKEKDLSLTVSGRQILLSPNFGNKHNKFMKTLDLDHIDCISSSEEEDEEEEEEEESQPIEAANHLPKINLATPLIPTPVKIPVKLVERNRDTEDDLYSTFEEETCTVCKIKVRSVKCLQEHILSKHCNQAPEVLEVLKMHQQLLNTRCWLPHRQHISGCHCLGRRFFVACP